MMKISEQHNRFRSLAGFLVVLSLVSAKAFAVNLDLTLTVSGSRAAAPVWQDGAAATITTLGFAFSGVAGVAATNVDSANQTAKLVNATSYPASVAVTAPSTCTIGATAVTGTDVKVLFGGTAAGATISLASNANQTFAIRFLSTGNYGDKTGTVACSGSGLLRYTY
jgi:hypothetical protein